MKPIGGSCFVFAAVVLAGCGGGGGGNGLRGNQYAGYIPSTTTTFTGPVTFGSNNSYPLGTATTVVHPDGSFTMSSSYGAGWTATGNIENNEGGESWPIVFNFVPGGQFEWVDTLLEPGTVYRGGGNWVFYQNTLTGSISITAVGTSTAGFGGNYNATSSG